MPELVHEPRIFTVKLTQAEMTHISIALGMTNQDFIQERAYGAEIGINRDLYKFFLRHADYDNSGDEEDYEDE